MKSPHQLRVEAFFVPAGQELPRIPTVPSAEIRQLRCRLILEEALELIEALGLVPLIHGEALVTMDTLVFEPNGIELDLAHIAKECADVSVVTTGTLSACGIHDEELLELVAQNNLEKFGPGGFRDENGKWRKPPGHKPPDIEGLLNTMLKKEAMMFYSAEHDHETRYRLPNIPSAYTDDYEYIAECAADDYCGNRNDGPELTGWPLVFRLYRDETGPHVAELTVEREFVPSFSARLKPCAE